MRSLAIGGLLLAMAILGYLIVTYVGETGRTQDALRAVPGASTGAQPRQPVDVTKRGLEQRLAPILDQERIRVEEANKEPGQ